VRKDRVGESAVHPQGFSIRRNSDPVRGSTFSSFGNSKCRRLIRKLDPGHFRTLGKIDHCESVEPGKLNKNATRRTVRVGLKSHRPYWPVELYLPYCVLGLKVNHC